MRKIYWNKEVKNILRNYLKNKNAYRFNICDQPLKRKRNKDFLNSNVFLFFFFLFYTDSSFGCCSLKTLQEEFWEFYIYVRVRFHAFNSFRSHRISSGLFILNKLFILPTWLHNCWSFVYCIKTISKRYVHLFPPRNIEWNIKAKLNLKKKKVETENFKSS